jgi:hypothetical protein
MFCEALKIAPLKPEYGCHKRHPIQPAVRIARTQYAAAHTEFGLLARDKIAHVTQASMKGREVQHDGLYVSWRPTK